MPGKAAKVQCTEKQQTILKKIAHATTASRRISQRAQIILGARDEMLNQDIGAQIGLHPDQVGLWRRRWQQSYDALVAIECRESTATLRRAVEQVLSDAPRSGSPGVFTAEQVTLILATACEPPENSGRPIDHWTHRELTDEVIQRGIVPSISVRQVGRYLKEADLQPHRRKYWLKSTVSRREFLENRDHRIRFVFTPKHSSWLNQIEIVFGIVYRRAVARASFSSLAALKERLLDFIEYFNRTFARPFRWTYTGRPVKSQAAPRPRTWRENWISSRQTTQTLAAIP